MDVFGNKTFKKVKNGKKKKFFNLLGVDMELQEAPDPSDIIWENLAVTKRD